MSFEILFPFVFGPSEPLSVASSSVKETPEESCGQIHSIRQTEALQLPRLDSLVEDRELFEINFTVAVDVCLCEEFVEEYLIRCLSIIHQAADQDDELLSVDGTCD